MVGVEIHPTPVVEVNSDIETGNGSIFHGNIGSIERIYAQTLGRFPALQFRNIETIKIYSNITGVNGYGISSF